MSNIFISSKPNKFTKNKPNKSINYKNSKPKSKFSKKNSNKPNNPNINLSKISPVTTQISKTSPNHTCLTQVSKVNKNRNPTVQSHSISFIKKQKMERKPLSLNHEKKTIKNTTIIKITL